MKEVSSGAFSFRSYKIKEFHFKEPDQSELNLKFDVSGIYYPSESKYNLEFTFRAFTKNDTQQPFLAASVDAIFSFEKTQSVEQIPEYFYVNSIAIVFPYLRAFVTTLTSVANTKPLILPILNLTRLGETLKSKTTTSS